MSDEKIEDYKGQWENPGFNRDQRAGKRIRKTDHKDSLSELVQCKGP